MATADHSITASDLGMGKKTLPIYTFGIILCVILTLIPFYMVEHETISRAVRLSVLFTSAIIQFFVQVVCFLRLSFRTEQGQLNVFSFVFSIFVLAVIVGGSMWIMWHLNQNMMM